MRLSTLLDYSQDPRATARHVADLESAGIDMVWVPEAYTVDAVSLLGYLAATTERIELASGILPIYSRTPTLIAMTAAGLDALSDGRFVLGLGSSGPQVIEGWHGVPFDHPVSRTEEVIGICRSVWKRERIEHAGPHYPIPLPPDRGTGLGKPLKMINRPLRERIPIYVASLGPRNVEMTASAADGWLPTLFLPEKATDIWGQALSAGMARRGEDLAPLEIVAGGVLAVCPQDRAAEVRNAVRPHAALYLGGMGARGRNFYSDLFRQYGYEREATAVQDLYLAGDKNAAAAAIPDEFLAATNLIGDRAFLADRIAAYREAGVTRLDLRWGGPAKLDDIATIRSLIG
jgi:F420-dependent oxidoreductase-like protein